MKRLIVLFVLPVLLFGLICSFSPHKIHDYHKKSNAEVVSTQPQEDGSPLLAIVIDDFGGYEQNGIDLLLASGIKITGAVIPFAENTQKNIAELQNADCEIIMHMPMQSHVNLPENWYGEIYIKCTDTPDVVREKLSKCLSEFPKINGFNIHIGSGVSRNEPLMEVVYEFAKENDLYFLDSRTIETNSTELACTKTHSIYLGRDVFLEANKNRTYNGVVYRLKEASKIAQEKGYAIAIGHVGVEGGENTAKAIVDTIPEIEKMGVKIVPLSEIYNKLKAQSVSTELFYFCEIL